MLRFVKEYFSLSNPEQKGMITLIIILLFVIVIPKIYLANRQFVEVPQDNTALIASYIQKENEAKDLAYSDVPKENKEAKFVKEITYFYFNPNLISIDNLMKLGFSESTATTLVNFRNKGGKFYKKEDLLKVYGLSQNLYNQIESFIDIPKVVYPKAEKKIESEFQAEWVQPKKERVMISINSADSATLTNVNGIGPTYASRIIKYKKLLGGFIHKDQLLEVYGLDEEAFDKIKDQVFVEGEPNVILVNKSTWYQLKSHPYISSDLANLILNYKESNGTLTSLNFLIENQLISLEELEKINPYLSLEE